MLKSVVSDQLAPSQSSVAPLTLPGGVEPPKANAAVYVPAPPKKYPLSVFKSFTSVHAVPFQDSVSCDLADIYPPKAKASVLVVPTPPNPNLAVFKLANSVHALPFHDSVSLS